MESEDSRQALRSIECRLECIAETLDDIKALLTRKEERDLGSLISWAGNPGKCVADIEAAKEFALATTGCPFGEPATMVSSESIKAGNAVYEKDGKATCGCKELGHLFRNFGPCQRCGMTWTEYRDKEAFDG